MSNSKLDVLTRPKKWYPVSHGYEAPWNKCGVFEKKSALWYN